MIFKRPCDHFINLLDPCFSFYLFIFKMIYLQRRDEEQRSVTLLTLNIDKIGKSIKKYR